MKGKMLVAHKKEQNEESQYWRIVLPDDSEIRNLIIEELHAIPFMAHPGVSRTINKVRNSFFWKGMAGDVRAFVEACPVCQLEKTDHTLSKGQLQSSKIPEVKWQEVSLDFITDLPRTQAGNTCILTVIDKATRMVHLIPCRETVDAAKTAELFWNHVGKLHGIPRCIYSDRGPQFCSRFWRALWDSFGTSVRYSSAYHPQTQGMVERMNSVVSQTLRCLIHSLENERDWQRILPTVENSINSLPNRSTGYSPFYLNYGFYPVAPVQLLDGHAVSKVESVTNFVDRIQQVWQKAKQNIQKAQTQQQRYYDTRHKPESFEEGSYVLLSTQNIRMKGTPSKLKRRFAGPFKILQRIGNQAYKLDLPDSWHIHNVFHVSLLKRWIEQSYRTVDATAQPELDLDLDQPTEYEVEKIIRKRRVMKRNGRFSHWEYLTMWTGFPIDYATWEPTSSFTDAAVLEDNLREDQPTEVDPRRL